MCPLCWVLERKKEFTSYYGNISALKVFGSKAGNDTGTKAYLRHGEISAYGTE